MILILSTYLDQSTSDVIDWLLYEKQDFIRVDGINFRDSNFPYQVQIDKRGKHITVANIPIHEITAVWFRRWIPYNESFEKTLDNITTQKPTDVANIKRHLVTEMRKSYKPFFHSLEENKSTTCLPKFTSASIEKIEVLQMANDLEISIPAGIICNSKKCLQNFKNSIKDIITKPIGEVIHYDESENVKRYVRTQIITDEHMENIPDTFFPSFFQEYIKKEIEIRSFYLDGQFYSMAIFSQLDEKTSVDFRNYNNEHPNRNVPMQLPKSLEEKLIRLMERLNLNTGSIDLILDKNNEFYFLEVNPVGQFGMTSVPCNYYLEKKIALSLTKNSKPNE